MTKRIFTLDDFEFGIDAMMINTEHPTYLITYNEMFETKQETEERLAELKHRLKISKPTLLTDSEGEK